MSGVADLLAELEQSGVRVSARAGEVVVKGRSSILTADVLARLRGFKAAILEHLRGVPRTVRILPPFESPWAGEGIEKRVEVVQSRLGGEVLARNESGFSLVTSLNGKEVVERIVSLGGRVVGVGTRGGHV